MHIESSTIITHHNSSEIQHQIVFSRKLRYYSSMKVVCMSGVYQLADWPFNVWEMLSTECSPLQQCVGLVASKQQPFIGQPQHDESSQVANVMSRKWLLKPTTTTASTATVTAWREPIKHKIELVLDGLMTACSVSLVSAQSLSFYDVYQCSEVTIISFITYYFASCLVLFTLGLRLTKSEPFAIYRAVFQAKAVRRSIEVELMTINTITVITRCHPNGM